MPVLLGRRPVSRLEREGLQPNADADRATLVRRLAFDLTGLPPTVPELYDFALSENPRPISELVDRYLDSPAYAERFARRWLDVARYAESAGKDFNGSYPHAWRLPISTVSHCTLRMSAGAVRSN